MALSKVDGTNFIDPTIPVASGGTGAITLAAAGLANTPAFTVYGSGSNQSISSGVNTKVEFDTTLFDTNSGWDGTNFKWTVPAGEGGKYAVSVMVTAYSASNDISNFGLKIRLNGSGSNLIANQQNNMAWRYVASTISLVYTFSAADYIQVYGDVSATSPLFRRDGQSMWFSAYKLIGV